MIKGVKIIRQFGRNNRVTEFTYKDYHGGCLTDDFNKMTIDDFEKMADEGHEWQIKWSGQTYRGPTRVHDTGRACRMGWSRPCCVRALAGWGEHQRLSWRMRSWRRRPGFQSFQTRVVSCFQTLYLWRTANSIAADGMNDGSVVNCFQTLYLWRTANSVFL